MGVDELQEGVASRGAPAPGTATAVDRRRPGRRTVSPDLIPLLRGEVQPASTASCAAADPLPIVPRDDLAAVLGMVRGVALSVPVWGALAAATVWMLRAVSH